MAALSSVFRDELMKCAGYHGVKGSILLLHKYELTLYHEISVKVNLGVYPQCYFPKSMDMESSVFLPLLLQVAAISLWRFADSFAAAPGYLFLIFSLKEEFSKGAKPWE